MDIYYCFSFMDLILHDFISGFFHQCFFLGCNTARNKQQKQNTLPENQEFAPKNLVVFK